jgi:hypothetical protein
MPQRPTDLQVRLVSTTVHPGGSDHPASCVLRGLSPWTWERHTCSLQAVMLPAGTTRTHSGASSCAAWSRTCPGTTLRSSTRKSSLQPNTNGDACWHFAHSTIWMVVGGRSADRPVANPAAGCMTECTTARQYRSTTSDTEADAVAADVKAYGSAAKIESWGGCIGCLTNALGTRPIFDTAA